MAVLGDYGNTSEFGLSLPIETAAEVQETISRRSWANASSVRRKNTRRLS